MKKEIFATLAVVGFVAAVAVLQSGSVGAGSNFLGSEMGLDTEFAKYMVRNGKTYATKEEYLFRRDLFAKQLQFITEQNSKNSATFQVGLNKFSDMTDAEFERYLGDAGSNEEQVDSQPASLAQPPVLNPIDWREKGAVGAVKDQGHCGSCWAFSTVGPIEQNYAIKYGSQIVLSEQQLVDCTSTYGNDGCDGGLFGNAYRYVKDFGLELEQNYTYKAIDDNCWYDRDKIAVRIAGTTRAPSQTGAGLRQLLESGPASHSLWASAQSFRAYKSGIYNEPDCGSGVNHAVQAVGWGSVGSINYFITRNSWGPSWGDKGYIYIQETDQGYGICQMLYRWPEQPIIV